MGNQEILSRPLAVKPFVGAIAMQFLSMVEADAGRLKLYDSPRDESIMVP